MINCFENTFNTLSCGFPSASEEIQALNRALMKQRWQNSGLNVPPEQKQLRLLRMLTVSFLWEPTTFPLPPALYPLGRPTPALLYLSLSIPPLHFNRYHQDRPHSWGDIHSGRTKTSTFRYCHMRWWDINSRDSRWGLSAQSASCGTFCVPMRFWLLGRWLTPARGGSTAWWDQGV